MKKQSLVINLFFAGVFLVFIWFLARGEESSVLYNESGNEKQAETLVALANSHFDAIHFDTYNPKKAEKLFKEALLIDPNVSDAWHQLARIDFLKGDFDSALRKIEKQIELHGEDLMSSFYIRGLIYGYMGEHANAEADFKKFIEWDPTNWAARNDLAWVYFSEGKFAEAKDAADAGLVHNPRNPWLLSMSGVARLNLGEKTEAEKQLKKALEEADKLSMADWLRAYPGNNPSSAEQGLIEMKKAIQFNYGLATSGENQM